MPRTKSSTFRGAKACCPSELLSESVKDLGDDSAAIFGAKAPAFAPVASWGAAIAATRTNHQGGATRSSSLLRQMRVRGIEVDDAKRLACYDASVGFNVS